MIIALFPNLSKNHAKKIALDIRNFLQEKGVQVIAEEEKAQELNVPSLSQFDPNAIDFLITLGGDGTILGILHRHPQIKAPILGINLGGLGFMADVTLDEVIPCLQAILDGRFSIQERLVISGKTDTFDSFAINEVVIHRGKNPSLIELLIRVGGLYLNTFSADGLIISTPNGSTAYSLSAGGPILTPDLEALVITPISPHTISNRPIVVSADKEIEVEYVSQYDPIEINYDGCEQYSFSKGEILRVTPSPRKFRLVNFPQHDFFSTLRRKLGWSGKLKI